MEKRHKDIIDEIHERRAELFAQFDNDLERYLEHLRERENEHPERVVSQIKVVRAEADQGG